MGSVKYLKKAYKDEEIFKLLDEHVALWFRRKYKSFTPPQKYAVKEIHEKKNVLISSPTGSGKTLSAFLAVLNELLKKHKEGQLDNKIYCIYISPLRALNNDIKRNLLDPIKGIGKVMKEKLPIRVGVRTSDTTAKEKAEMLRKPPHILITTPESLAILLNSPKFSLHFKEVQWVIVDEIHSLVENKRGSHLSLSLERLAHRNQEFVRIGLSATISPLEEVAKFLAGEGRDCAIVDVNYVKQTEIEVLTPVRDLIYTPTPVLDRKLYQLLDELIEEHDTTLIFTNTRSGTERVVANLKAMFGKKYIENLAAHHSSLSRRIRLDTEEKLKRGEFKAVVSSTSLELGIDIGSIDLVVLLGSPKSAVRALQRIGRSGHRLHETSKSCMIGLDRDDVVECSVIARNALERRFGKVRIPKAPLDVLSQHIVGMAIEQVWDVFDAYELVKRAYPYRELSFESFKRVIEYLSGAYEELEVRNIYAKIWYEDGKFGRRGKMIRAIYYMNVGTIPEEAYIKVFTRNKEFIGEIEEAFAERLIKGDIFALGGKTYEFLYSRGNSIVVEPAYERKPTIPAWYSEMLPLDYNLALDIEAFREDIAKKLRQAEMKEVDEEVVEKELMETYKLDEKGSSAVISYIKEQDAYSIVPGKEHFLVEEYLDIEESLKHYIFHTLAGRKANEVLARIFAYVVGKDKGINVRVSVSDYGFVLSMPRWRTLKEEDIKKIFEYSEDELASALRKSIEGSEILRRRFRHVAARGFLILKRYGKKTMSANRQQISADSLLKFLLMYMRNFPLIEETYREVLYDAMHIDEAFDYLKKLGTRVFVMKKGLAVLSPFAFNLLASGATDVVMLQDRRTFVKELHRKLMEEMRDKGKR